MKEGVPRTGIPGVNGRLLWLVVGLSLVAGVLMLAHPDSVYRSAEAMDAYFGGQNPPGSLRWPGSWTWSEEPFRFRLIFHGLVDGVFVLLSAVFGLTLHTYWAAYVIVTLASIVTAGCGLVVCLKVAGCSDMRSLFGFGLWLALPPIHLAFVLPTQTKEDFLAYGLFAFGLAAIIERREWVVALICAIGAFTRETVLLVAMVYLLTANVGRLRRFVPLAVGLATLASVRLIMGIHGHRATYFTAANFSRPAILVTAVAAIFGAGWLFVLPKLKPRTLVADLRAQWRAIVGRSGHDLRSSVYRVDGSTVLVLVVMLAMHVSFGRIQEIRITALAAPMLILVASREIAGWDAVVSTWKPVTIAISVLASAILLAEASGVATIFRDHVNPKLGGFATKYWWLEFYVQLALAVGIVTSTLAIRRRGRSPVLGRRRSAFGEPVG